MNSLERGACLNRYLSFSLTVHNTTHKPTFSMIHIDVVMVEIMVDHIIGSRQFLNKN